MKKIDALGNHNSTEIFRYFGITPSELIALGMEYYKGRGNQGPAGMWEALIEEALNPKPLEPPIDVKHDGPDHVIGRWVKHLARDMWEIVTIKAIGRKFLYLVEPSYESNFEMDLIEIRAKKCELRRFRHPEGRGYANDRMAILIDGKLAFFDELGLIRIAEPR